MTTRTDARTSFLTDIYTCALEGGIGYWSTCTEYRWSTTQRAVIEEIDNDDREHVITLDTVARGLNAITTGRIRLHEKLRRHITAASRANDAGDIDAGDADLIVQAGIFGEITYG
ncbi:hypothetical protein [Gordonia tangerina]|uniref:Uncharacterized protein n=1 Tax=Gordonia tangerina TaxID=2911060 RepID=A0ABS9DQL7_9ACTN|nr:hypothetical protein [Gordonia tangerina]MCF3941525.1 hypothetical protein [Gordonia tangerina]